MVRGLIVIRNGFLAALLKFFFPFHNNSLFGSLKVLLKNNGIVMVVLTGRFCLIGVGQKKAA